MKYLLQICFVVGGLFCAKAEIPPAETLAERVSRQLSVYPQEKIFVHTDKPYYMAGDTVWFRAHVVDAATHAPVAASKYVYVELQSHEKPASGEQPPAPLRVRVPERDGVYAGYIPIPMTAKSGDYTLSAYTLFMQNAGPEYFFRTAFHVGAYGSPYENQPRKRSTESDFEVSFFPEGGCLIDGVECCVGFKALKPDGNSAVVSGRIVDAQGRELAAFGSFHAGMGTVRFTPRAGQSYYAECTSPAGVSKRFRLPASRNDACILQLFPTSTRFSVCAAKAPDFKPGPLKLLIHCRGTLCYCGDLRPERYQTFNRKDFPDGVLQLLLLDEEGNALSERLLLCCNEQRRPAVEAKPDKPAYGRREKVSLSLQFKDADGKPLSGNFSVAVTDNRIVDPYRPADLRTALLLESELRGYVEEPAFYFDPSEPTRYAAADALMLTQGWRRYDIPKVLKGEYAEPAEPLEIGQEITGSIRKTGVFRKRNFSDYRVDMLAPARGVFLSSDVDSTGRFSLNGFDLPDSSLCVLRAVGPNGREDVELLVDAPRYPLLPKRLPVPDRTERMRRYNDNLNLFTDSLKNILLDEVVISAAPRKVPTTPQAALAARSVDYKEIASAGYSNVTELLRSKGVTELGGSLMFRGKEVVFYVDGLLQDTEELMNEEMPKFSKNGSYDESWAAGAGLERFDYDAIPIDRIGHVDIVPAVNSTLFGSRAKGRAVVCITTKNGSELLSERRENLDRLNLKTVDPIGYQRPAEFYSPVYDTPRRRNTHERDLRTTLYWNPAVRIAPDGQAVLEFYTGDEGADYTIRIESTMQSREGVTRLGTFAFGI